MLASSPFRPAASKRHRAYHVGGFFQRGDGSGLSAWYCKFVFDLLRQAFHA
jgi:hypothetical protein